MEQLDFRNCRVFKIKIGQQDLLVRIKRVFLPCEKSAALRSYSYNDFTQKYGGIIDHFGLNNPDFDWEGFSLKKISKEARRTAERVVISHVLEQTGWNRLRAQKILKISYKTLLYKIEELNLTPPKI